jgi:hypothetical protein
MLNMGMYTLFVVACYPLPPTSSVGASAPFGCWYVQNTLDPMIVEGLLREIIVVGVDNTDQRTYELTYRLGWGAHGTYTHSHP